MSAQTYPSTALSCWAIPCAIIFSLPERVQWASEDPPCVTEQVSGQVPGIPARLWRACCSSPAPPCPVGHPQERLEERLSNQRALQLMVSLIPLHVGWGSLERRASPHPSSYPEESKQCALSHTPLTLTAPMLWQREMGVGVGGDGVVVVGPGSWIPVSAEGEVVGQMADSSHEARLPQPASSATSGCNTHVLWGGWTLVYSPSAKLSECQKLLMLNSKRKLSKEQEQRMLFQQPGRMQVSGRWPRRPASISSKMFTMNLLAVEVSGFIFFFNFFFLSSPHDESVALYHGSCPVE